MVRLTLTIRRFYCHEPACARRTFAKRLPRLLDRYAQRTHRLADAQVRTALALGATPAARLLPRLAMPTSAMTLLRGIREWPLPTRQLEYKAAWTGRVVIAVLAAYTSQDCSACGTRGQIERGERTFACETYGEVIDRDTNAARNIRARAII